MLWQFLEGVLHFDGYFSVLLHHSACMEINKVKISVDSTAGFAGARPDFTLSRSSILAGRPGVIDSVADDSTNNRKMASSCSIPLLVSSRLKDTFGSLLTF